VVLPKNFDNPDEAMAIARAYSQMRERKLLGEVRESQKESTTNTEKQDDKAE
jgi:hypothetical protein